MPKCLFRYQWVKLPRAHLPVGKGIMGYWAKLASRAAFRKGRAKYCGYTNDVMPGMWSGGVVGLKSILGVKSRTEALEIMNTLSRFGYIRYTLDEKTKKLEYAVTDWVVKCSGAECMSGTVYATDGYSESGAGRGPVCTGNAEAHPHGDPRHHPLRARRGAHQLQQQQSARGGEGLQAGKGNDHHGSRRAGGNPQRTAEGENAFSIEYAFRKEYSHAEGGEQHAA